MKADSIKNGMTVCHRKYGRNYRIVSAKCMYKDSTNGWTEAVCYAPLYPNDEEMFMREVDSFLEEFEIVE